MSAQIKCLADDYLQLATTLVYTVPASNSAVVLQITLVNTDVIAQTCNIFYQKSGSATLRNIVPVNLSLAAGYAFPYKLKLTMAAGDTIKANCSVGSLVNIVISGVEVGVATPAPGVSALFELHAFRQDLTVGQVMTLFSSPVALLAADPNYAYLPTYVFVIKNGTNGYTMALQSLWLNWTTTPRTQASSWTSAIVLAPTQSTVVVRGPIDGQYDLTDTLTTKGNKGFELTLQTSDPTVGGDPLSIIIYYYKIPVTPAGWAALP